LLPYRLNLLKLINDFFSIVTVCFAFALTTIPSNNLPRIDNEPLKGLFFSPLIGDFVDFFTEMPIFLANNITSYFVVYSNHFFSTRLFLSKFWQYSFVLV
ncbi:uncharacterized protein METZ01_LOCUS461348, partial [marine metagenome]